MTFTRFPRPLLALITALAACGSATKPAPATAPPAVDEPAPPPGELAGPPPALTEPARPAEAPLPPIPEAPPPPAPAPPHPHVTAALAMLPAASKTIVGIDVAQLATTPMWAALRSKFADLDLPASCDVLRASQLGYVVVGTAGQDQVMIAESALAQRAVIRCVEEVITGGGGKLISRKLAGTKVYQAKGDDELQLAWPTSGVVVLATTIPLVTATLDRRAAKVDAALAAAATRADHTRLTWAAGSFDPDELAALGLTEAVIQGKLTWRLAVDLATETDVDLVISFTSAADAQAFAGAVQPLLDSARRSLEFQGSVSALQIGFHGAEIRVMARLNAHATAEIIKGMTERIVELTRGTPGG